MIQNRATTPPAFQWEMIKERHKETEREKERESDLLIIMALFRCSETLQNHVIIPLLHRHQRGQCRYRPRSRSAVTDQSVSAPLRGHSLSEDAVGPLVEEKAFRSILGGTPTPLLKSLIAALSRCRYLLCCCCSKWRGIYRIKGAV